MTSECKSVQQTAMLTTDAVPIPSAEVQNANGQVVSGDNSAQNQLADNDLRDSEESEDPQEEHVPNSGETGNVKPIIVEPESAEELPPPKEPEDKMNKTVENPVANNLKEKKKRPSNDKRIMKQNNSLLPGPAPSVVYSIKNVSGLQIGPNITINMASKQEKSPKMSPRRIPRDVEEMFKSTVPVTKEDLETVSPHVGRGWRQVGRRLNFSDGELDQFKADYIMDGMKEVIYQMLLAWQRAMTSKATRGTLCSVLWSADLCDAAERLVRGQKVC